MDYAMFHVLASTAKDLKSLLLTYDIACLWSVHFMQQLKDKYGDIFKLDNDVDITFAIPKSHIPAHGLDCQCAFNLNYLHGAARTCSEGIETGWAELNAAAPSTREMSWEHCHEVLNSLFGVINFCKLRTMGK
jgi:hypothetical protein